MEAIGQILNILFSFTFAVALLYSAITGPRQHRDRYSDLKWRNQDSKEDDTPAFEEKPYERGEWIPTPEQEAAMEKAWGKRF